MPLWLERALLLAGLASIVAIVILSLIPGEVIHRGHGDGFDKHFIAYFICAALLSLGQSGLPRWLRTVAVLVLLASTLEVLQFTTETRTPRWIDYFGGVLGTGTGVLAGALTRGVLDRLAALRYTR